jgi:hypothetical protein
MMPGDLMDATSRDPVKAAKKRAEQIRKGMVAYVETLQLVADAYGAHDWEALGYDSWDSYVDGEFGARVKLDVEQRRRAVEALRLAGMSTRAIGAAVGASEATVRRDLEAGASPDAPSQVTGVDGKSYPAQQPAEPAPPAAEETPAAEPDAEQPTGSCEACATALSPDEAKEGYRRCNECDPDGDHVEVEGVCTGCNPRTIEVPDPQPAGLPEAQLPDEWGPDPAAGGATTSAIPGNPSSEAPGEHDPDKEYRPWREYARGGLGRARHELRQITGDLLDADMVAERADGPLLDDLEKLASELLDFVARVRALRPPREDVWVAAQRHGTQFHRLVDDGSSTACGRSTHAGVILPRRSAEVGGLDGKPCPRCWPHGDGSGGSR